MLSIKKAAEQLGIHWKTLYGWIINKKIKAIKIGQNWKIEQSTIDELKQGGK